MPGPAGMPPWKGGLCGSPGGPDCGKQPPSVSCHNHDETVYVLIQLWHFPEVEASSHAEDTTAKRSML